MTLRIPRDEPKEDDTVGELRSEMRLERHETIYIEIISSSYDYQEPASIAVCSTVDVSANGLQVTLDHTPPVGSILSLCVQFSEPEQRLHLVGEVRWVKPLAGSRCHAGFVLYESEGTDIQRWKQRVATLLR